MVNSHIFFLNQLFFCLLLTLSRSRPIANFIFSMNSRTFDQFIPTLEYNKYQLYNYSWRYFFSTVMQFQLHRHLCRVAGQYDPNDPSRPLHKCDIYRSKAAGNVLKEIMQYGSTLTWNEVLSRVTNENKLDGTAVRDFFRPLEEWLRNENLRTQEYPGWIYDGDYCKHSIETAGLYVRGGSYNKSSGNSPNAILLTILVIFTATVTVMKKI